MLLLIFDFPHYNPAGVNLYPDKVQIPEGKLTTITILV